MMSDRPEEVVCRGLATVFRRVVCNSDNPAFAVGSGNNLHLFASRCNQCDIVGKWLPVNGLGYFYGTFGIETFCQRLRENGWHMLYH